MKWMRETTVWDEATPNHLYLMEGDNCHAYVMAGSNEHKVFAKPLRFDLRRRTFVKVKEFAPVAAASTKTVTGSKGEVYEVDTAAQTCTCPGFKFRGTCKHVAETQQLATIG